MSLASTRPAVVTEVGDLTHVTFLSSCTGDPGSVHHPEQSGTVMTSRTTFGDLAESASRLLEAPAQHLPVTGLLSPGQVAAQADELLAVLPRLVKTMSRYAADVAAVATPASETPHEQASSWASAAAEVRQAAQNACQALPPGELIGRSWQHRQMTSSLTRNLGAAASVITAARDLLHTHFHTGTDGTCRDRSEWAPVITSASVRRALLGELAEWSRHVVSHGTRITSAPPRDGSGLTTGQRRVLAICRPLTALITAVETAHNREPVTGEDVRKLYQIPVNMLHPRSIPAQTETVTKLQVGIVQCAERVRSAAATAVTDPAWSPAISPESFTQTALCAAAISHHCEILQQTLAARAAQLGATRLRNDLVTSAAATARARQAWLAAARAWYHIKTDAPAGLSPATQEGGDLAQWTGRLTYADPGWTLTSAPSGDCRPPNQLAPDPGTFARTLTAAHQAIRTLTTLATADYTQIQSAARNGRLLVPAVQVPGSSGSASAYTRATGRSSSILLTRYRDAGTASIKAAAQILRITSQYDATDGQATRSSSASPDDRPVPRRIASTAVINLREPDPPPGPIERVISGLGATQSDLLNRAIALDKSVSQLIAEAADRTAQQRWHSAVVRPGAVTNPTRVTRQVLGTDHPAPAAQLRTSLRALAANTEARPQPRNPRPRYAGPFGPATAQELPKAS